MYPSSSPAGLALTVWALSSVVAVPLWLLVLRWVLLFASPSLAFVSSLILIALLGVVSLALYWDRKDATRPGRTRI